MTIDDGNTVSLGNNWTFSVWAKNLIPPVSSSRSTLFRGHHTQGGRDYDRFLVIRGSDRMLCFYDGDDGNGNNRYRSTGYEINPLDFSGWHNFAVVAAGGRTNYYINGKFVGDADRREQSVMKFIGNSSSGELFAEYLDDIRIYGISLSFSEVAAIYGGGFGDQYPSILLTENSTFCSLPQPAPSLQFMHKMFILVVHFPFILHPNPHLVLLAFSVQVQRISNRTFS